MQSHQEELTVLQLVQAFASYFRIPSLLISHTLELFLDVFHAIKNNWSHSEVVSTYFFLF